MNLLSHLTAGALCLAVVPLAARAEDRSGAMAQTGVDASVDEQAGILPEFEVVYCGGETTKIEVRRFFAALRQGLEENRSASYFDGFLGHSFGVTRDGRHLRYNKADFSAATPSLISPADWESIAKRGEDRLEPIGWRGCMMDNGKVWFEAGESGLRLSGINHDIPWKQLD